MQEPLTMPTETPGSQSGIAQDLVPQMRSHREELLEVVEEYTASRHLVPPLTFGELQHHTEQIIRISDADRRYTHFIAVLVNNAVWRESLARIPYDRRLLLLPQCLRSEDRCSAAVDEFGLVCNHCGLCPIHDLQTEAEKLGYSVLVAEGTTIAGTLIESGQIQAIVGVSCLSSLERIFPLMEAAAVPGIAIPLLQNGCVNTRADLDWVWDAVYLVQEDATRGLDLNALRTEVDSWFTPEGLEEVLGPAASQTEAIARDWLARSGKRWRPFLAVCTFGSLISDPAIPVAGGLRKLAVAVECFHKASLVHDDIEDRDAVRYGAKTLHEDYGIPIAINTGDFLLGEGYRMIAELPCSSEIKAGIFRVAAAGHRNLSIGQGEELCWRRSPRPLNPDEVLEIFRRKTAPAFEVALRMGAVYAGADHEIGDVLGRYSEALGIAYQIRDDLEDSWRCPTNDEADDVEPSLLLSIAWQEAAVDAKALLENVWREPGWMRPASEKVTRLLAELNVEAAARRLLESYQEQAIRCLQPLDNASLKGLLRRVIGKMFRDVEPRA